MRIIEDIHYRLEEWFAEHKEQWRDHGLLGFKCPACDGTGGEFEYIVEWEGIQYDCGYCHGTCYVGLWKKLMSLKDFQVGGEFSYIGCLIRDFFKEKKRE